MNLHLHSCNKLSHKFKELLCTPTYTSLPSSLITVIFTQHRYTTVYITTHYQAIM